MGQRRVFYFCYDHQNPRGGQKQTYRHVDILNEAGLEAYALHLTKGTRLTWFDNDTRVVDGDGFIRLYRPGLDTLVLPEDLGEHILGFPGRKVIFNQNAYNGFYRLGLAVPNPHPYLHPDICAVMVVSDDNAAMLRFAFPSLKIMRVINGVDPTRFTYRAIEEKKRVIACVPTKNRMSVTQLFQLLQARAAQELSAASAYTWALLENKSHAEVATLLGDALITVFLGVDEGFSLVACEAMLSGSLLAAFRTGPLLEALDDSNALLAGNGDIVQLAQHIEGALAAFVAGDLGPLRARSSNALAVGQRYSPERERASVLQTWSDLLNT